MTDLVLIPGLNNTGQIWDGVAKYLNGSVQCHTPTCPALPEVEAIAAHLLEELPQYFHLCGFSFGGYVALAMLERAPERILGLALIGSSAAADTQQRKENRLKSIQRAQAGEYETMIGGQAHLIFHPDNLERPDLQNIRLQMQKDYGADRFIAHQLASIHRPDRTEVLIAANIPTLVIAGEEDRVIPSEGQQKMAERIPGATFRSIAGCGHMLPLEKPEELGECLGSWIHEQR